MGSGKTALVDRLSRRLRDCLSIAAVTNDIYTREDAEFLIRADVAAGRLVPVLPETAISEPGFFLYFPKRSAGAPKLRVFLDAARRTPLLWGDLS